MAPFSTRREGIDDDETRTFRKFKTGKQEESLAKSYVTNWRSAVLEDSFLE